jgi:restriction endonuclease S subunit
MQGSVYVTLKLNDLENFEIPLPPINVQLAVAEKHDALQILIEKQKHLVATMQVDVGRMVDEIFGE